MVVFTLIFGKFAKLPSDNGPYPILVLEARRTERHLIVEAPRGLPVSEELAAEVLSLPMHPYLSERDQDRIINAVRTACVNKISASNA